MRNVRKNFLNSENSKKVNFLIPYSFEFVNKPLNKPLKQLTVSRFDGFTCIGK